MGFSRSSRLAAAASLLSLLGVFVSSANATPVPTCEGLPATVVGTTGTPGDDVIIGTAGADTINGKAGNDKICGLGGDDILQGGDGDDVLRGGDGNDQLRGGTGDDTLRGDAGNDDVRGQAGDDDSRGGAGADEIVEDRDGNIGDLAAGDDGAINTSPGDVCRIDAGDTALASCDNVPSSSPPGGLFSGHLSIQLQILLQL